ncbi:MAG: T9SS C-terminal target domain-containing protein [Ignavibacteriae bacterium]|nr:MAG: T9SS C-terminal target domain-containing protein [Ignavibacteriota bacterium]
MTKILITFIVFSQMLIFHFSNSQTFTKITSGEFVNDGGASRSVNFIDYDNDGDLDLYVTNGKRFGQRNFLYNNTGGVFTRVFNTALVNDSLPYDGSSWADYDNDGDADLCAVTWYDSTNMLYQNNGSGNFVLVTGSPILINRGFSETCSWGDYDNDGLVDLFITNSEGIGPWRNRLYKNTGNGNFASVDSGAVNLDVNRLSRGVNWVDIDGDRDLDIFVCNENNQNNIIYNNNGAGYFTKVLNITPVTTGGNTWSSSWGDYDNDGDLDLFCANWNQKNFLFKNDGNFNFTQITNDTIVNEVGNFACSGWGDYDNDGDLDMFVTQAYKTPNSPLKNNLYKNQLIETGNPTFEKITSGDIVNDMGYSYGFAWADWDGDGDLDIFIAKTYNENENNAAYLNNGNNNKWLEVKCVGRTADRSAIGTKVKIKAVINNNPVWIMREVDGQSGYCGQTLDLHFGLGNAPVIDTLKVEWLSGNTSVFTNIPVNQKLTIDENGGIIGINNINNDVPERFTLNQNYPNPFNPKTIINYQLPMSNYVKLTIYDVMGKEVNVLVNEKQNAGKYEIEWDASNYPSGIYFYKLKAGQNNETRKMMLIK